jgi:hypothetical protein
VSLDLDALHRRLSWWGSARELEGALADELLSRPGRRMFAAGSARDVI